jgi:hypothetical protein
MWRQSLSVCVLAFFLFCGLGAVQGALGATTGTVISVTDIHFDPFQGFGDPVRKKIATSDYTDWRSIYLKNPRPKGDIGQQTNFSLLDSTIREMQSICPHPDFIIFSGDLLGHGIEDEYKAYLKHNPGVSLDAFVQNTLSFINYEFKLYFSDVPIYFTLGNNDNYIDFGIAPPPVDTFLPDTKDIFFAYIGDAGQEASFMATFPQTGGYSVYPAAAPTNKIIALNDIYFSTNSKQSNNYPAGWQQMTWLASELASAAQNGEKVWIISHIPPGVDVGTTLSNKKITDFWQTTNTNAQGQTFLEAFSALTVEYSSVIAGIFCGHTHMDHFRLISDQGGAIAFVHVSPAVSPQFGNNPAFQVLTYDRTTFGVIDFETYRYGYARQTWGKEYSFDLTYDLSLYDPANLETLFDRLPQDAAARKHVTDYFDVNNPGYKPITAKTWQPYWCGIAYLTNQDFVTCEGSVFSPAP